MPTRIDRQRGLDHGAWVPLMLMYPRADIPVVQLSVQTAGGPPHHLSLGCALKALRRGGVLVVGSGSFTHDLSQFCIYRDALSEPEPIWVSAFADWFDDTLSRGRLDDLADYRPLAPYAERNHRTEGHLLPLFVALGATDNGAVVERLHSSTTHGVLRMDVYSFGHSRAPCPERDEQ
jgi:4,5-DOPA dioxygenase extradiol